MKAAAAPSRKTIVKTRATATRSSATGRRNLRVRRVTYNPWKEPTYADSTDGDLIDGEDLEVRRAAVDALGPLNGSVVVVDPNTGRVLTIVNQKVALKGGYTPCSTIKIFVGMAALSEGLIDRETMIRISRRMSLNITDALAQSDNPFFQKLGFQLGFERVSYYARLFGLGERATLGFDREMPGSIDNNPPDGIGYMSSHGHGVRLTPLQLAAAISAIANGGTLYYLQYPETQLESMNVIPRVKRKLDIDNLLPSIRPGLQAAVDHGTARRAGYDDDEPIFGKTGTCTDRDTPTHLGWFGSYNQVGNQKLAVVVLLTGGRPINGPVASEVAGRVYKGLSERGYFARPRPVSPLALMDSGSSGIQ